MTLRERLAFWLLRSVGFKRVGRASSWYLWRGDGVKVTSSGFGGWGGGPKSDPRLGGWTTDNPPQVRWETEDGGAWWVR